MLSVVAPGAHALPTQVIPNFGGSSCESSQVFCWDWLTSNWASELWPRTFEHVWSSALAVLVGALIAVAASLFAVNHRWFEQAFSGVATVLYTIPSLAFFQLLVPFTGLSPLTIELALTGYMLLLLFENTVTGLRSVPPEILAAADGMGLTPTQILFKVRLPLALPSLMAGVRIAVVTAISLATVGAFVFKFGLGASIFDGIHTLFNPRLFAASILAIVLALLADALVVGLQRLVTPWVRATRGSGRRTRTRSRTA